jgi:hypothetical protein
VRAVSSRRKTEVRCCSNQGQTDLHGQKTEIGELSSIVLSREIIMLTDTRIIALLALVFRRKEMAFYKNDNRTKREGGKDDAWRASPCSKDGFLHASNDLKPERVVLGNLGTAGMLALDSGFSLKPWTQPPKRLDPKSTREYLQILKFQDPTEVMVDFTKTWLAAVRLLFAVSQKE